ncbi:1-acyl-sn-glycerol-3-phosphate acyltransferase [Subtercola sp. PAMC28395]|uniref:lysophospholipid acyltransferase family protein n=1 Tax=Subtercola sp. PAMC28395 TaxID=2846775 RepID=UPI001C0D3875|nr:lysophospholipid acyltransferase family protein [Subtercola sp. PAMC28395]QWT24363.1 1-acyl-sn-glycerol-3-phosphate acyltransferase [Subtercola sp. PAMC28395]
MKHTPGKGIGRASAIAVRLAVDPVVRGLDQLADHPGPYLFVANHPSELDAALVSELVREYAPQLVSVGVEPRHGLLGLADQARGLRSVSRLSTLLHHGVSLLLFPERHRSDDGSMTEFDLGAARLGIRSGVTIVPVALVGTFRALPPWRVLPESGGHSVTVVFGAPIRTAAGDEPSAVNASIVEAITLGMAEATLGWYGALRAQAEGSLPDTKTDETAAHWRRVWNATKPERQTRRQVWT